MKTSKTIATICAVSIAATMMTLPVQAKTYPTKAETITMDDATTTAKSKSKKTTDEYKDFGKDLKITVHNPDEITQAYLYATMMCAKSLKITLAKDYKITSKSSVHELSDQLTVIDWGVLADADTAAIVGYDTDTGSVTLENFGDVMSYFTYVYRTGDTTAIPENYEGMYDFFAKGVDSCTADADSITDVADNVCKWLKTTTVYGEHANFKGKLGKSRIRRTAAGKMLLNCEGYAYVFKTMMHMAGYTAYWVFGDSPKGGHHAWNAIKVGDEYRYYDSCWFPASADYANMTYKEMIKAGYTPWAYFRDTRGKLDSTTKPTQKDVEALFIDWRY